MELTPELRQQIADIADERITYALREIMKGLGEPIPEAPEQLDETN